MNEQAPGPLKIDLRVILNSIVAGLAFMQAGVAAVDLERPYSIIIPLVVGATIVMIYGLLGRSSAAEVAALTTEVRALMAKTSVLELNATPTIKKAADDAAEAMRPAVKT